MGREKIKERLARNMSFILHIPIAITEAPAMSGYFISSRQLMLIVNPYKMSFFGLLLQNFIFRWHNHFEHFVVSHNEKKRTVIKCPFSLTSIYSFIRMCVLHFPSILLFNLKFPDISTCALRHTTLSRWLCWQALVLR